MVPNDEPWNGSASLYLKIGFRKHGCYWPTKSRRCGAGGYPVDMPGREFVYYGRFNLPSDPDP
jgi:hypothetical protein